jgi:hypothetical protein
VSLQTEVDAYARADAFISFPGAGAFGGHAQVEVEEAYATLTQLPWGLTARAGKLLANFGRLNMVHTHELDQVERPLALTAFSGSHGIGSVGAEASASRGAGPLLVEATYALLNDLGVEADERKVEVTAPNGATVEVKVDDEPSPRRRLRDFDDVAKLRAAADLSETWTADAGVSGALHQARLSEQRRLGALDLSLKWKPLGEGLYRSFLWPPKSCTAPGRPSPRTQRRRRQPHPGCRTDRRTHPRAGPEAARRPSPRRRERDDVGNALVSRT